MKYTVTSVTKETVAGEEEVYIPSKIVRNIMEITELDGDFLINQSGDIKAYIHIVEAPNYDKQEMVLVEREEFLRKLGEKGLEIVWFADFYRSKNPLNDSIKSNEHPMKSRKYFIYFKDGHLVTEKFWDARFLNQRDGSEKEAHNKWIEGGPPDGS